MKRVFFLLALFVHTVFLFAARAPAWVSDIESEFPKNKYIARLGSGSSADSARTDAVGQIASFFKSEVTVSTSASSTMRNDGAKTEKNQQLERSVSVMSDITLTAVEYNSPYHDKWKKTYYVVAYIERTQGWQAIEPQIMRQKSKYGSFLELAGKEAEPVMRYKYLVRAKDAGEELLSALYMGYLIDPSKKKEYRTFAEELSQSQELGTLDSYRIPVLVEATGDYENTIASKVEDALKSYGFTPVSGRNAVHDATVRITIESNMKSEDEICTIFPEVSVSILGKDGRTSFYSYHASWGKTVNFSLAQAQKKAFPKIAEEIRKTLAEDFWERFLLK